MRRTGGIIAASRVRYVQFAEQFTEKIGEVIVVVDMRQEAFVGLVEVVPVRTVHIRAEEAFALFVVDIAQHILALGGLIYGHRGRESDRSELLRLGVEFAQSRSKEIHIPGLVGIDAGTCA